MNAGERVEAGLEARHFMGAWGSMSGDLELDRGMEKESSEEKAKVKESTSTQ